MKIVFRSCGFAIYPQTGRTEVFFFLQCHISSCFMPYHLLPHKTFQGFGQFLFPSVLPQWIDQFVSVALPATVTWKFASHLLPFLMNFIVNDPLLLPALPLSYKTKLKFFSYFLIQKTKKRLKAFIYIRLKEAGDSGMKRNKSTLRSTWTWP